jgi:GMP synthase (glutamine-hydrolysing)
MGTMRTPPPHRPLVVIEHEASCPLDRFAGWLDDVPVRVVRPYAGDAVPTDVDGGLLVLGGTMSAYDDAVAPWLPAVRDLLAGSVERQVPTLGICLGAQLLAVATGGRVDVGAAPGRESGVIDAHWRPEAAADALVAGLPDPYPGPSMHADAIVELPTDAVWLAASAMYPHQVFRVGPVAWGVQFHPEVSLATFAAWAAGHDDVDTDAMRTQFRARDRELVVAGRALARRFGVVSGRIPSPTGASSDERSETHG